MITLAWYLLKVIICSGILCGYYFWMLRNKTFHRWNRFYILASVVLALTVPLMKINIFQNNTDKGTVVEILQTISYGDEAVIEYSKNGSHIDAETIMASGYVVISAILLFIFFIALYKIRRLKKKFPETKIKDISFINTNAKGTPFSFLNSIFWNNAIDLHTKPGQQIFNHEIAHIKEKHSYDKIFLNVILIFFWTNPFFWLMRKELYMIHEFIADQESLEGNDLNAFGEMILQTVYPGQQLLITNNFFYSPIKRRLFMLAKNKNPKVNYVSRLLVLPLAAIVFFAFTIKMKAIKASPLYDGKTITVVIDAGHGGEDNGALENNIKEKDLTWNIAKQVKELNGNKNINIILTRDNDEYMSVKDKINFANAKGADLFISIHIDKEEKKNSQSGINVLIPANDNKYLDQSKLLGSAIMEAFRSNYPLPVANDLRQREKGPWVLTANQCPTVLIEAGFLTTQKDFDYLTKSSNQQMIARNILNGIENYAQQGKFSNAASLRPPIKDSIPLMHYKGKKVTGLMVQSKSRNIKVTEPAIKVTYNDGSTEMISKQEADKRGFVLPPPPPPPNARHFHGKISSSAEGISGNRIVIHFKDGTNDTITREEAKKAGFILFKSPVKVNLSNDTGKIFVKVETEASFPGGYGAWQKYIVKHIQASLDSFTTADLGTCILRFIVNTDGTVREVTATTMKGTQLATIAINAIKNGPKWIPASQNGKTVASYRLQPVTLTNPDAPDKVSDNIENKTEPK